MRRLALLLLLPASAVADSRLDLEPIPDLRIYEPVYDIRKYEDRHAHPSSNMVVDVGVGWGTQDGEQGLVGEGSLQLGRHFRRLAFGASSEVVAGANELVRGRHAGFLELRTEPDDSEDFGGRLRLDGLLEHGRARGLAPVYLGPGERDHGAASAEGLLRLAADKGDAEWAALVEVDGSATRWLTAPALDHATRRALGLGLVVMPTDDEMPHGRVDLVRARVEHATITRKLIAAGIGLPETQVRTIDVMAGPHEMTFAIDHELLLAMTEEFGASWIETDTTNKTISGTFFKMNLAAHAKWRRGRHGRREVGFALAREPGVSPDGQHIVSDWRLELVSGHEDKRFVIALRGGISWISHKDGAGDPDTVKRYGSHLEGFVKLGFGIEAGGYHAMTYEPQVAGDPWSSPRQWSTEVGGLVRIRTNAL